MKNRLGPLVAMLAACCLTACSDSVEYQSRAPDGRMSVTVGQPWDEFEERLAVRIEGHGIDKRIYVSSIDFRIKCVHAWWTPDSAIVTIVACNSYGPPERISYDISSARLIDNASTDILNPIRSSIESGYQRGPRDRCRYDDPLVWICCPDTSKK